jgi:hypothetical protein
LQFEHLNTAVIYTVHADGMAGESVKTHAIVLPPDASAARVIINNAYGATGSTVVARVKVTALTDIATITKTQNTQPLEWISIALATYAEATEINLAAVYAATVHVDVAIVGTTAHLGTEILVQIRKEATVDEWTEWARLVSCAGLTAYATAVLSTAAASQKVIAINNPTATGLFTHLCKNLFILDATIAQCEIVWLTACGADA